MPDILSFKLFATITSIRHLLEKSYKRMFAILFSLFGRLIKFCEISGIVDLNIFQTNGACKKDSRRGLLAKYIPASPYNEEIMRQKLNILFSSAPSRDKISSALSSAVH